MSEKQHYYDIPEDPARLATPELFSLELSKQSLHHTERDLWYVLQEQPELQEQLTAYVEQSSTQQLDQLIGSNVLKTIAKKLGLPIITTVSLLVSACTLPNQTITDNNQNSSLAQAHDHIKALNEKLDELFRSRATVEMVNTISAQTNTSLKNIQGSIRQLISDSEHGNQQIHNILATIRSELESQIDQKLQSKANQTEIDRLQGQIQTLDTLINSMGQGLQQQLQTVQQEVSQALATQRNTITSLQSQLQVVADYSRGESSNLRSSLIHALNQLKVEEEDSALKTSQIHQLFAQLDGVYNSLVQIWNALSLEGTPIEDAVLQGQLETLSQRLDTLETALQQLTTLATDVANLQENQSVIWGNIENFSRIFGDVYAQLGAIQQRLDLLEEEQAQ